MNDHNKTEETKSLKNFGREKIADQTHSSEDNKSQSLLKGETFTRIIRLSRGDHSEEKSRVCIKSSTKNLINNFQYKP